MKLTELSTPCALVDRSTLERNTTTMAERARRLGVRLRPHVKTHKCVAAARLQVRGHFGGITVSTFAEARAFAAGGFTDITCAVPLAPARVAEAAELARLIDRLGLLVDQEETAAELERCAAARGQRLDVLLKVDCGFHRAGVDPARAESLRFALRLARSPHLRFRGLLTHAGHAYACRDRNEVAVVARQERAAVVGFAERLRAAGAVVEEVSVGSTPTLAAAVDLGGVTEARPGNYVFHDAFQVAIGSCAADDVAFTVLATVLGRYPERGTLVLDAGALALSKDPGAVHVDPACGYGWLGDATGGLLPGLRLAALSQEHGLVRAVDPALLARLPPGARVRIIPNHSCLAAACFDRLHVVHGDEVVDEWPTARGW